MEPRFFPTSYLLDAFLRLDEKGIVKPGESKKGLEMGIRDPLTPLYVVLNTRYHLKVYNTTNSRSRGAELEESDGDESDDGEALRI